MYEHDSRRSLENLINVKPTCQKQASANGYAIFLLIIDGSNIFKKQFSEHEVIEEWNKLNRQEPMMSHGSGN